MVKLFSRFNDKPAVAAHAPRPSVERQQPIGPLSEAQWLRLRRPENGADGVLSAATLEWLNALPEHVRPVELARRHARLANRICICWSEPPLLDQVMDNLLLDQRSGRKGFSPAVVTELMALLAFHSRRTADDTEPSPLDLDFTRLPKG